MRRKPAGPIRDRGRVMLTQGRKEREQNNLHQDYQLRRETYAPSRFCTET